MVTGKRSQRFLCFKPEEIYLYNVKLPITGYHVTLPFIYLFLPLLVLIGPPLIAKTSFRVQPSAMLQTQTDDQYSRISEEYFTLFPGAYTSIGKEGHHSRFA